MEKVIPLSIVEGEINEFIEYIRENADFLKVDRTVGLKYRHQSLSWSEQSHFRFFSYLPFDFVWSFKGEWVWTNVANQYMTAEFVTEFKNVLPWWALRSNKNKHLFSQLPVDIIKNLKYFYDDDWRYLCSSQILSEEFMRTFSHRLNWQIISMYQDMSEEFIWEFRDKIDWFALQMKTELRPEFRKVMQNYIEFYG